MGFLGKYDPISVAVDVGKKVVRSGVGSPGASRPAPPKKKQPTTAQRQRARVGHLRGAIQTNKDELASLRARAKSGSPDAKRKARMAQQSVIDRIKNQAQQRERDRAKAKKMGWTDKDLEPRKRADKQAASTDSGSTPPSGTSTPRATASAAVARATGSQARPTSNPTRPQAPKPGTVLAKAMGMKDKGKGISISADELAAFQKNYARTHGGKKLSRTHAVMMARYIKSRGGQAAKTYGLGKYEHNDG